MKTPVYFSSRALSVFIVLLFFAAVLQAQVKIKSKIGINSHHQVTNKLSKTTDTPSYITAPRNGVMTLVYYVVTMDQPLQGIPNIKVSVNGDDFISEIIPSSLTTHSGCDCDPQIGMSYEYSNFNNDSSIGLIYIPVSTNDIIQITYSGQNSSVSYSPGETNEIFNFSFKTMEPIRRTCPDGMYYMYASESGFGYLTYLDDILLGKSRYYYATVDAFGYPFITSTTDPTDTPFKIDNVSFEVFPLPTGFNVASKLGAYWEDPKPTGTGDFPDGMVHLVGRYWDMDAVHGLYLAANFVDGEIVAAPVITIAPQKLLTPGQSPTYKLSRDIFDHEINIDSTCIYYGGKYGIPPQIIKGQIFHESDPKFSPCYRYEPRVDIDIQKNHNQQYLGTGKNFVVTATSMGNGPTIPNLHTNFRSPNKMYPKNPITIRNYLADNGYRYIKRKKLIFIDDATITATWKTNFNELSKRRPKPTRRVLEDESLSLTMESLRNKEIGKSEYDWYAQTRIMASYGFLQLTHYNATDGDEGRGLYGFTKTSTTQPPELLNEVDYNFSAYGERMYKDKNTKKKVWNGLSDQNWPNGYEQTWLNALDWYNHGERDYEKDVMKNAKNYLPAVGE
jgi:hypothetical protein